MQRKGIDYSCEGRLEKSVPMDHRLSSIGKPNDAKRRSSGRIFLFYPHTHDRFLKSRPSSHYATCNEYVCALL